MIVNMWQQLPAESHYSCIKMQSQLQEWPAMEVLSVIRFLLAKEISQAKIHRKVAAVYGANTMTFRGVSNWCHEFETGRMRFSVVGRPSNIVHRTVPIWSQVTAVKKYCWPSIPIRLKGHASDKGISCSKMTSTNWYTSGINVSVCRAIMRKSDQCGL